MAEAQNGMSEADALQREILALRGKLRWDDAPKAAEPVVAGPRKAYSPGKPAIARKR